MLWRNGSQTLLFKHKVKLSEREPYLGFLITVCFIPGEFKAYGSWSPLLLKSNLKEGNNLIAWLLFISVNIAKRKQTRKMRLIIATQIYIMTLFALILSPISEILCRVQYIMNKLATVPQRGL